MASQRVVTSSAQDTTEVVNPMVDEPTEGLGTMAEMFATQTVDEVVEVPIQPSAEETWWVIRPNKDIENMTVGNPNIHYNFKAMQRYKVPTRVAEILYNREHLAEVPHPLT